MRRLLRVASGLTASWLGNVPAVSKTTPRKVSVRPGGPAASPQVKPPGQVERVEKFGTNPGQLRMSVFAPGELAVAKRPMIVLLHGCGQEAATFAADTGWIGVARRLGLVLVLPEQIRENNRARCFNWFEPEDVCRGGGEAASIRQMIRMAEKRFQTDARKTYVVGLSAGGAMAAAMLAAYPTVFAAGAVVAGMPVGSAHGAGGAILRMHRANGHTSQAKLVEAVRLSSPRRQTGTWPRLSIWQGDQDRVLDPANADILATQFAGLHTVNIMSNSAEQLAPGVLREVWGNADRPKVELWRIAGMGHGFPIDARLADGGRSAPAVLDVGLSGADHIARFFGLAARQAKTG